jgi:hypothetical protein
MALHCTVGVEARARSDMAEAEWCDAISDVNVRRHTRVVDVKVYLGMAL